MNYSSHWYLVADPSQKHWPSSAGQAPLIDISWPAINLKGNLEKGNTLTQKAVREKSFQFEIHRDCFDETVNCQIDGIAGANPDATDNSDYARFSRWSAKFLDCEDVRNATDFYPALAHLRDRLAGKKFEECKFAVLEKEETGRKEVSKPQTETDPLPPSKPKLNKKRRVKFEFQDYREQLDMVTDEDTSDKDNSEVAPGISRDCSDRLFSLYNSLDPHQKQVFLTGPSPHGTHIVSGCPGSGKTYVMLRKIAAIQAQPIDVNELQRIAKGPGGLANQPIVETTNTMIMTNETHTRFSLDTSKLPKTTYEDAPGFNAKGLKAKPKDEEASGQTTTQPAQSGWGDSAQWESQQTQEATGPSEFASGGSDQQQETAGPSESAQSGWGDSAQWESQQTQEATGPFEFASGGSDQQQETAGPSESAQSGWGDSARWESQQTQEATGPFEFASGGSDRQQETAGPSDSAQSGWGDSAQWGSQQTQEATGPSEFVSDDAQTQIQPAEEGSSEPQPIEDATGTEQVQEEVTRQPLWRKGTVIITANAHDQLTDILPKVVSADAEVNGRIGAKVMYLTSTSTRRSDIKSLMTGKFSKFDEMTEDDDDLDPTTMEYIMYDAAQTAAEKSKRVIRGDDYNIAHYVHALIDVARENGPNAFDEAKRLVAFMESRERDPANFTKDKAKLIPKLFAALEAIVINQADYIIGTPVALNQLGKRTDVDIVVSHIFIDEAFRMSEPDTLAILSAFKDVPFRSLAGDREQLGPLVLSSRADHDQKSETFFCSVFARQLLISFASRWAQAGVDVTYLRYNWRAERGASTFCSERFYGGMMIEAKTTPGYAEAADKFRHILSGFLHRPVHGPMINVDLTESHERKIGKSFVNYSHATYIAELVSYLHSHDAPARLPTTEKEGRRISILVIAMYAEQVEQIITELKRINKTSWWSEGVRIRTTDGSQGCEDDVIILDQTRTDGLGFVGEHSRVNVAYSRARMATITVHNSSAVSARDYRIGNPAVDVVVGQRKFSEARNALVQIKRHEFCSRCHGPKHKGACNIQLCCSICHSAAHHTRECHKRVFLNAVIPKLKEPEPDTEDTPTPVIAFKNTTSKRTKGKTPRQLMGRADKVAAGDSSATPGLDVTILERTLATAMRLDVENMQTREARQEAKRSGKQVEDKPDQEPRRFFTNAKHYHKQRKAQPTAARALTAMQLTPDRFSGYVDHLFNDLVDGAVLDIVENWSATKCGPYREFFTRIQPIGMITWKTDEPASVEGCGKNGTRNVTIEALIHVAIEVQKKLSENLTVSEDERQTMRMEYVKKHSDEVNKHNSEKEKSWVNTILDIEVSVENIQSLIETILILDESRDTTVLREFNCGWTMTGNPKSTSRTFSHMHLGSVHFNTNSTMLTGSPPAGLKAFLLVADELHLASVGTATFKADEYFTGDRSVEKLFERFTILHEEAKKKELEDADFEFAQELAAEDDDIQEQEDAGNAWGDDTC
ncbi:hypothetical protein PG988_000934 [Apiospora saccharicola]